MSKLNEILAKLAVAGVPPDAVMPSEKLAAAQESAKQALRELLEEGGGQALVQVDDVEYLNGGYIPFSYIAKLWREE